MVSRLPYELVVCGAVQPDHEVNCDRPRAHTGRHRGGRHPVVQWDDPSLTRARAGPTFRTQAGHPGARAT